MGISRAAQSPTSIHRNACVNRLRRRDVNQARSLWWWGKHSRGWWTSQQDDMEERLRRHQALMMHRYTKALRRRSLWDREGTPSYPWGFKACKMDREMSSTDPTRAKVEDRQPEKKVEKQAWHEFHKDFDSFKKAVDRAIERDAYGTLFGRRLRSPDSGNNSSWTSWSWIFDPKEIKEDPNPENSKPQEKPSSSSLKRSEVPESNPAVTNYATTNSQPSVSHSSSSSKTTTTLQSSHSIIFQDRTSVSTEYVYDPISGRKVPQSATSSAASVDVKPSSVERTTTIKKETPKKGLIESLFTEHGTEIPVKVYKPPKIYGFTGETKPKPKADASTSTTASSKTFQSSRKRDYDNLRLRTLGNNIDATNFNCEPWNNKSVEEPRSEVEQSAEKRVRTSPGFNEDTPLFVGTTYESKSGQLASHSDEITQPDDFRAKQGMTLPSLRSESPAAVRTTDSAAKIQAAMDRMSSSQTEIPVKRFASKLEPALDRSSPGARLEPAADRAIRSSLKIAQNEHGQSEKPGSSVGEETVNEHDTREDVDLLRASDIRAGTKSARVTKQAIEEKKQQNRKTLEQDFDLNATSDKTNLENVWKHVRQYPNGIVAKTMQSLGQNKVMEKDKPSPSPPKADTKFSEPTVRPDVIRDLRVEHHTQVFEPKVANIVDQAKSVKRELHDVSLSIGDVVNERAITAMANRDLIMREVEPMSVTARTMESSKAVAQQKKPTAGEPVMQKTTTYGNAPFVILLYPVSGGDVQVLPMQKLALGYSSFKPGFSAMTTLGSLLNPSAFVKHFADLDKNGYELIDGARDVLLFRKKETMSSEQQIQPASIPSKSELRATIAAAEAGAQPETHTASAAKSGPVKAAEVLDEIPTTIPTPGPAAPTAPTSSQGWPSAKPTQQPTPASTIHRPVSSAREASERISPPSQSQTDPAETQDRGSKPRKLRGRMTRQEEVFSGQQRLKPHTTALPDPEHFQKQRPFAATITQEQKEEPDSTPRLGFFARVRRAIRRTLLTALAFGTGAYGIGVIAEGLQARAQIDQGEAGGPMKRLVLENDSKRNVGARQRAGIFSTESSR